MKPGAVHSLLVTCPEPHRSQLTPLTRARLLARCRSLDPKQETDVELSVTFRALRALATRIQALTAELRELDRELQMLTEQAAPALLAERGFGPIGAAQTIISWSYKGRFRSEAAFAKLAGVPPIPASSGQTIRHRLDRGGDRKLNSVLHQAVITRRKNDPETIAYIERKRSEGKSDREAIRLLKRYLARRVFRLLEADMTT